MKLNEKGKKVTAIWEAIWEESVKDDIAMNGDNYECGWDVMFQHNRVHNADDFIGVIIAAYGENALDYVDEVCYGNGFCLDDVFEFGVTFGEYMHRIARFFDNK